MIALLRLNYDRASPPRGTGLVRAVWLREFGPPSVLVAGEADEPVAGPGQVLIEVEYANVTFVETQVRARARARSRCSCR